MNEKEIGEIRRRVRRDRSNMPAIFGCFVNDQREIVTEYRQSTGIMSENEAERYFGLLKRTLSGTVGKNLLELTFQTAQVAGSEEHKLLMDLRACGLKEDSLRRKFYQKIIDSLSLGTSYLILVGCDSYDVPFKSKDGENQSEQSSEVYTYLLCAICPVKQTNAKLHYVAQSKDFHDGGITQVVSAPEVGFLFPAFDNRSTNIYNALYYNHSPKENYAALVDALFHTPVAKPAAEQKKSFEALLAHSLEEECSMEAVQNVHDQLRQCMEMHKEARVPEPLLISKEQVKEALSMSGVSEAKIAKFSIDYDEAFGFEAELHPRNIIDSKRFAIKTPDVSIQVAPERSDLIETRVIGGVKYILINAEEDVEVNGVSIHIGEREAVEL